MHVMCVTQFNQHTVNHTIKFNTSCCMYEHHIQLEIMKLMPKTHPATLGVLYLAFGWALLESTEALTVTTHSSELLCQ